MESMRECPEPLVSILVPSYNHEAYVVECLESIKALQYGRLELILSDDGSSDATFTLTQSWVDRNAQRFERILAVKQERNLGVVANVQFLLDNARGEFLAFIASDDAFLPSAIGWRVEILRQNPNLDAVFGNAQKISANGEILEEEYLSKWVARAFSRQRLLLSSLILNWSVPGPVNFVRRDAFLEGGCIGRLPPQLGSEDWYIYYQLALAGRLLFVNRVVSKYRFLPSSMSQTSARRKAMLQALIDVDRMMRGRMKGMNQFLLGLRIAICGQELRCSDSPFSVVGVKILRRLFWLWRLALILVGNFLPIAGESDRKYRFHSPLDQAQ